ncbi:hypothetical protein CLOP_g2561, partial [Closterium sp. NIES-67]
LDLYDENYHRPPITSTGLHALFTGCTELQTLSVNIHDEIKLMPSSFFRLSSLTDANLNFGLSDFPDEFGGLKSLKKLTLEEMYIGNLSESFGLLTALTELNFSTCKELYDLPDSIGDLCSLKKLTIFHAESLEVLPDQLGRLHNLEEVQFLFNESLCQLPLPFFRLPKLRILNLWELGDLPELEGDVSNLVALETLSIDKCRFTSPPASLCKLPNLRCLKVTDCMALNHLPRSIGSLPSLQRLELSNLRNVKRLPGTISKLSSLRSFSLKRCNGITTLPASLFQNCGLLTDIEFDWPSSCVDGKQAGKLSPAEAFLSSLCRMSSLAVLALSGFPRISTLSQQIGNLSQLKQLKLSSWPNLAGLPDSMSKLTSLESLVISLCPAFKDKAAAILELPNVRVSLSCNHWEPEEEEWGSEDEEGEEEDGLM